MQNNLDYKLERVTTVVDEMKHNLRLDSNAPIEEVSAATDLKKLLNVFVQADEPECKDGVWLQTEPFDYVDFTVDEDMHLVGDMEGIDRWPKDTMPYQYNNGSASDSNGYYLTYSTGIYFFPYNNYTTENWLTLPKTISTLYSYDGYLYSLNDKSGACVRINIATKEIETLPVVPVSTTQRYYVAGVGRNLYVFASGEKPKVNILNIDTLTWSQLDSSKTYLKSSLSGSLQGLPVWNGKIIVPHFTNGSGYSNYTTCLYDPETNLWSDAPSQTHKQIASMALIGTELYVITLGKQFYKIDLLTNTQTQLTLPYDIDAADDVVFNCNDQLVYHSTKTRRTHTFAPDSSSYDHDTIVIVQGKYKETNYLITLYNVPKTGVGNFKWPLSDILPYIGGEFKGGIPTYYGNGTEWIKFKN